MTSFLVKKIIWKAWIETNRDERQGIELATQRRVSKVGTPRPAAFFHHFQGEKHKQG